MVDETTPVDAAFARCRLLERIVGRAAAQASADPTHARNVELGLTEKGDRKADAARKIAAAFEELAHLVNHLAILDMAAALETLFKARLGTAIGEGRRAMREHYEISTLWAAREHLIREATDFAGLRDIEAFLGGHLSEAVRADLGSIRAARNRFAHGTDIRQPPAITSDAARDTLAEVASWL